MLIVEDQLRSNCASHSPGKITNFDNKVKAGLKRGGEHLDEDNDSGNKRVKMRDLQSVLQSERIDNHDCTISNMEETEDYVDIVETRSSQVVDKNAVENADAMHSEKVSKEPSTHRIDHTGCKHQLDLNSELCTDETSGYGDTVVSLEGVPKKSSCIEDKADNGLIKVPSRGTNFDLNAEDVASSAIQHCFYGHRSHNNMKSRNTLEFGRKNGHPEKKEALRKWKEMKKNGFISTSYGGIPAAPKPRGRKSKNDVFKQKMEQAKKEQVDRFTKIAAPSGLLNGLNPGIINHVRNSRQVHSIIQALVKSEKKESRRQASELKAGSTAPRERITEQDYMNSSSTLGSSLSYDLAPFTSMSDRPITGISHLSQKSSLLSSLDSGHKDWSDMNGRSYAATYVPSRPSSNNEDDILALKLSPSTIVSESVSCVTNGESENVNSVDALSVKAASVASQWLQLLQQDINGRLAALRRSKKRVHTVITTELPFLLSKEFSSNQEKDPCFTKGTRVVHLSSKIAELHQARWGKLFNQMDSALSEEEKQLEHWLQQVTQMQECCDQGLQHVQWNTLFEMQHWGSSDNQFRSQFNDPEKELSVKAAAASIYSTCNFFSRENLSCC